MLPLVARVVKRSRRKVPKHFYMVFPLKNIKQLERGVLPGIKGLSASPDIIKKFLGLMGSTNFVLRMPGRETLRLNNLTEVSYTNPKKLMDEGGIATLSRLTGADGNPRSTRYQLLRTGREFFGDSLGPHVTKDPSLAPLYLQLNARGRMEKRQPDKFKGFMRKITSFDATVKWFRDYLLFWAGKDAPSIGRLPNSLFVRAMLYSIRGLSSHYEEEKEWGLQRGRPLKIPEGSLLYVTYFDLPLEWMTQYRKKGKDFLEELGVSGWGADNLADKLNMNLKAMRVLKSSNLASHYRIILLDPIKFKAVAPKVWF